VLSAVLIMVVFLSILGGALMGELSSAFLVTHSQAGRIATEASLDSSTAYGIGSLEQRSVPVHCVTDQPSPSTTTLNGMSTASASICRAIVPDVVAGLAGGTSAVDGTLDTVAGRNRYLITDSGGTLRAYQFGQSAESWARNLGGPQTGPLLSTNAGGSAALLIPAANPGSGCSGHCVALFNSAGVVPSFRCSMPASTAVSAQPAVETPVGGKVNFPDYAFIGSSGAQGRLYVYDASPNGSCEPKQSASLGGTAVGAPLVFPGSNRQDEVSDDVFVLVTSGAGTTLQHWSYTETTQHGSDEGGGTSISLDRLASLNVNVGAGAIGYSADLTALSSKAPIMLAIASASGRLALARISVSGSNYSMSLTLNRSLPNGAATNRSPYWCTTRCGGTDLIGVGGSNGTLYLLNASLNVAFTYTEAGLAAINTTPIADANGDWYFGDDNGFVYDVELPAQGTQMFKAASFGPGAQNQIRSSPYVGSPGGCSGCIAMYFGAAGNGGRAYFAQIGKIRVMDVTSCLTSGAKSTTCSGAARLWTRVEVGDPQYVGGQGVNTVGWAYSTQGLP
jgi:hypothetical protein